MSFKGKNGGGQGGFGPNLRKNLGKLALFIRPRTPLEAVDEGFTHSAVYAGVPVFTRPVRSGEVVIEARYLPADLLVLLIFGIECALRAALWPAEPPSWLSEEKPLPLKPIWGAPR